AVRGNRQRLAGRLARQFLQRLGPAPGHGHAPAGAQQRQSRGLADAGAAAGDDRDLAGRLVVARHESLLLLWVVVQRRGLRGALALTAAFFAARTASLGALAPLAAAFLAAPRLVEALAGTPSRGPLLTPFSFMARAMNSSSSRTRRKSILRPSRSTR